MTKPYEARVNPNAYKVPSLTAAGCLAQIPLRTPHSRIYFAPAHEWPFNQIVTQSGQHQRNGQRDDEC